MRNGGIPTSRMITDSGRRKMKENRMRLGGKNDIKLKYVLGKERR